MPHVKTDGTARVRDAFELRCHARAKLWQDGEIEDLHDAVDPLQAWAMQTGLVRAIGQDAVQAIMAQAFAAVRTMPDHHGAAFEKIEPPSPPDNPGYHVAAIHGVASAEDMQALQDAAIKRRANEPTPHASAATVEALMYALRTNGVSALRQKKNIERLKQLSSIQLREVISRLIKMRARYPAITNGLLTALGNLT